MSDEERKQLLQEHEQDRRAQPDQGLVLGQKSPDVTAGQVVGSVAGILFVIGGVKMLGIESEAGDTIFEAFFQAMAFVAFGLAAYSVGRLVVPAQSGEKSKTS